MWCKARVGEMNAIEARARIASISNVPIHTQADETICSDADRLAIAATIVWFMTSCISYLRNVLVRTS